MPRCRRRDGAARPSAVGRNPDGSTQWLPGASGESGFLAVNYDDVNPEQTILAMGHTHPYSKQEGGYRDAPFSGRDLALHVYRAAAAERRAVATPSPRGCDRPRPRDTAGGIPAGAPISAEQRLRAAALVHARTPDRCALPRSPLCMAHPVWSHWPRR